MVMSREEYSQKLIAAGYGPQTTMYKRMMAQSEQAVQGQAFSSGTSSGSGASGNNGWGVSSQQTAVDELKKAQEAAKAANESRYQEILKGYQDRYSQAMGTLQGMGDQEKADIRKDWQGKESQGYSDMVSRGLTSTTVLPTMQAGYQRRMTEDLGRADERLRQQQLQYQTGLQADTLGFMERREDEYPDLSMYYNMLQNSGNYGGSAGYGSGSSGGTYRSTTNYGGPGNNPGAMTFGKTVGADGRRLTTSGGVGNYGGWTDPIYDEKGNKRKSTATTVDPMDAFRRAVSTQDDMAQQKIRRDEAAASTVPNYQARQQSMVPYYSSSVPGRSGAYGYF